MGGSIGGLVGGIFGGDSAPSAPNVNVYQPTGTSNVDQQLQQLLTKNYTLTSENNPFNTYAPQFQQLYNQMFNNPYAAGAQGGANTGGASYGQVGGNSLLNSTALSGAIPQALSGASSVLNMGMDPQQALYNQQLQQTTDRANVTNAQYGLTGQQAAGAVNQADTNFNIDWQNQELQRAISGLTGYNQTLGATGTASTAAQNVGAAGAGSQVTGGNVPYQQFTANSGNQSTALQQYIASLLGPQMSSEQTIGDLSGYLGQGISASTAGQQAALASYAAQLQGAQGGAIGGAGLGGGIDSFMGGFNFLNPSTSAGSSGGGLGSLASTGMSALSMLATVLCTAFHKRGMISREIWAATLRYGQAADPYTFAGYLLWATPIAKKVTKDLWFAKLMAPIFIPPLICEAAIMGCKTAKPTLYGRVSFGALYGLFWATGKVMKNCTFKREHAHG